MSGRKVQTMLRLISKNSQLLWIVGWFFLTACGQVSPTANPTLKPTLVRVEVTVTIPPGTPSHANEIGGYVEVVDKLRAAGVTVEPGTNVEQPFFEVSGQLIKVNGLDVQVFEFPDEATRENISSLITPEGQPNPTTMVDWVDRPNFWARGQVIVLYVGEDQMLIDLLTQVLGDPITTS